MSKAVTEIVDEEVTLLDYQVSQRAYPAKYLVSLCRRIGIKNRKQKRSFVKGIRHIGERYISLKRGNQNRLQPNQQNKLFSQYKDALQLAQYKYKEIQESPAASGKLGKAIRKHYSETTEPAMKEMFEPFCTSSGMAITLFEKFLGILAEAAEDAKSQDIGNDKADLSGFLLTNWIGAIGKFWPDDASITFALGKYDSEVKIYTSASLPIIHEIICKLEPSISDQDIETAMRNASKENLVNQPIAVFFLN